MLESIKKRQLLLLTPLFQSELITMNGRITEDRLTLQCRAICCLKPMITDRRVGLEVDVHGPLCGLEHRGDLSPTECPQQWRAGYGAIPDL